MIKGCNKRVIVLKDPKSDIFEEAYFIVKDKNVKMDTRLNMVDEANRIIEESLIDPRARANRYIKKKSSLNKLVPFLLGVLVTLAIAILYSVII